MVLYYNRKGSERKELVKAIEELTGIKSKYLGAPSMAYQIGDFNIDKEGTLSWPDLNDADPEQLIKTEYIIEQLLERGFEAEYPGMETAAGIAVSMPRNMFDDAAIQNLKNLVEAKQELIKRAFLADELPIEITDETVGFPWFIVEPDCADAYGIFIQKICEMAITQKRISAKQKEIVNEKYEFRCFLLRLGLIGDEYKAQRKFLLKNLSGSAAFKSGHKKGGEE